MTTKRHRSWALLSLSLFRGVLLLVINIGIGAVPTGPALADNRLGIWIGPDPDTPDFVDMFRHPELWVKARSSIDVMAFGPPQLESGGTGPNTLNDFKSVDAFRKLSQWGIKIAADDGAVKEWDCTGLSAALLTARHIKSIADAGAALEIIAMDEPAVAGIGPCKLSLEEAAARTAGYARAVRSSEEVWRADVELKIGDIEPYPSLSYEVICQWITALEESGFKPAFFHLDIDRHAVAVHPEINMSMDLVKLRTFLKRRDIPLGVIFWSGYDPLGSDLTFYRRTMTFLREVRQAIGQPEQSIFQSWITRSPATCDGVGPTCRASACTLADGPLCGGRNIPLNLPEGGVGAFTLTRLVNEAMKVLSAR